MPASASNRICHSWGWTFSEVVQLCLCLHRATLTCGCVPLLSPAELQALTKRRKGMFTPSLLFSPTSPWRDANPSPQPWLSGGSSSSAIRSSSPVRRHTLLHCAYSMLTVAKKSSSRRLIFANGIILWQMEMICSKQHPTLIGKWSSYMCEFIISVGAKQNWAMT